MLNTPNTRVVIVRSAVPVRSIGFIPGTVEDKMLVYEQPYISIATELFGHKKAWSTLKDMGCSFIPTSYIRGITLDNCIIIVDEAENMTFQELDSIVTRCGSSTRLIICGDDLQADIPNSGLSRLMSILSYTLVPRIDFLPRDIVRSAFVKDYILARDTQFRD